MNRQHKTQQTPPERKRGRPRGHNREPLTEEERRARNAQYERERRGEQAEASAELASAMGCEAKIKLAELLALTVMRLKRAESRNDDGEVRNLQTQNEALQAEIAELEALLPSDYDSGDSSSSDEEKPSSSQCKRKRAEHQSLCEPLAKKQKLSPDSSPRQSPFVFKTEYENTTSTSLKQESDTHSQGSTTAESLTETEAEDFFFSSDQLVELESLINNNVFVDEIPSWSSLEDVDFKLFPPTT